MQDWREFTNNGGHDVPCRPINVLFMRDHLARTGGTTYLLETVAHFDPREVRASVCVLQPRGPASRDLEDLGLPLAFLDRVSRDPRRLTDLNRIVSKCRADVLHLLGPKSFLFGRLLGHRHGIPTVPHFHGLIQDPPLMGALQRSIAPWTAAALAPSLAARDWAAKAYRLAPEKIEVIYNGHNIRRFAAATKAQGRAVRREFGIADSATVIGLVGRVQSNQKGQDVMIRLMPEVLDHLPQAVLLVVGDGPDLNHCRRLAKNLGISDATIFPGYRTDIPEIMAAVDVSVVPSVCEETFAFVALEAAAAGRPVVAFRSGGIPEVVVDGKTGVIVPKGDGVRLCQALIDVLTDAQFARHLADNGRARAAQFTLAEHTRRLVDFYGRVAGGGQS